MSGGAAGAPSVAVVGAGMIGLATARALALRGARVTVVERDLPAAGTSSRGEGNLLVSDKELEPEARLAVRALELWAELAEASPEPFEHEHKGGIVAAWTDRQMAGLQELAAQQAVWGIDAEVVDGAALRGWEPGLSPALIGGVRYEQDAQLMPILAVRALVRMCRDLGVELRTGAEAVGLAPAGDGVRLLLGAPGGRGGAPAPLDVDAVVLAAGPWSGEVAARLGGLAPVFPRRGHILVTEPLPPGTVRHKVYDGSYVDAVASDESAAQVAPVVESTRAGTVLIGSSREAVSWAGEVPWPVLGRLARAAVELFPGLATASAIRTYHGFRPATPDHLPLIGPDAQVPGLWHHSGHEGAGIGLAPASAELLAAQVLGAAPVDPAFDPRRFAAGGEPVADRPGPEVAGALPRDHGPAVGGGPVVEVAGALPRDGEVGGGPVVEVAGALLRGRPAPATRAARMLDDGVIAWRRTRFGDRPRGLFCGIGHCHDCIAPAPDGRTVRTCLAPDEGGEGGRG